ncbi:anthrone oxygenase family protein [Nocardiopsis sp. EMB25]|uniref:anthrone oxygenase family protein n=1 Tax=Nocardiopsis sp. EMB25 TaxID=2835867 RepID=UPI003FA3912B
MAVPVLSVVLIGLFAGLFFAFSVAVMPGLRRAGDQAMIETMQGVNVAILNPLFALVFLGAPVAALVTAARDAVVGAGMTTVWSFTALAALLAVILITFAFNIPRNNALEAAGPAVDVADPAAVRGAFEAVWVRWNHVRTLLSVLALVCSAVALALR